MLSAKWGLVLRGQISSKKKSWYYINKYKVRRWNWKELSNKWPTNDDQEGLNIRFIDETEKRALKLMVNRDDQQGLASSIYTHNLQRENHKSNNMAQKLLDM